MSEFDNQVLQGALDKLAATFGAESQHGRLLWSGKGGSKCFHRQDESGLTFTIVGRGGSTAYRIAGVKLAWLQ